MIGPDYSSSEDEFADDGDYFLYKEKMRKNAQQSFKQSQKLNESDNRNTKIKQTISNGSVKEVSDLIDSGVAVNSVFENGWTPFLLACFLCKSDIVQELVLKGADITSKRDGMTPLMLACRCPLETTTLEESLRTVKILLDNGADARVVDRKKQTALMFAAYCDNLEVVKLLLPLSDKLALDGQKWNALFWAVYGNSRKVVTHLLDDGFPTDICDVRNNTPIELARQYEFQEIVNLFPIEQSDIISNIINSYNQEFRDIFENLKPGEKPQFFLDICSMLYGVKNQNLIEKFHEMKLDLKTYLSVTDEELEKMGVRLPYQRSRILTGIYRFHKHPFLHKSISVTHKRNGIYSTIDTAGAIMSAVKHIIVMEASISFMKKNLSSSLSEEDREELAKLFKEVNHKISSLKLITGKLVQKVQGWDSSIQPADLITKYSKKRKVPWRKMVVAFGFAIIVLFKIM